MKNACAGMLAAVLAVIVVNAVFAAPMIVGRPVEYTAGGVILRGYLAYDANVKGKRPGVLVVHEWWGHNTYARKRARMLAELGYTVLAVDMYGNGRQTTHPDDAAKFSDAGKFSAEVMKNFDLAKARFQAAEKFLKQQPSVDPTRIAAIGYSFGGGVVLNMARQGADLKAVASFHGSLAPVKPAQFGAVKANIGVYNGADDKFTTPEAIESFKHEMTDVRADFKFINYRGAVHGFTNPDSTELGQEFSLPMLYNAAADLKSWEDLKAFFAEVLMK